MIMKLRKLRCDQPDPIFEAIDGQHKRIIYRDIQSGFWYQSQHGTSKSRSELFLGFTKSEALAVLSRDMKTGRNKPVVQR